MAQSDPIKPEELVSPDVFSNTIQSGEKLIGVLNDVEAAFKSVAKAAGKQIKGDPNTVKELNQQAAAMQKIDAAAKMAEITNAKRIELAKELSAIRIQEKQALADLKKKQDEERASRKEAEKAAKEQAKQEKENERIRSMAKGSINAMREELKKVTAAYNALSDKERDEMKVGKDLAAQKLDLTNKLKKLEAATGDHRRNVGNYTSALDGLGNQFVNLGKSVAAYLSIDSIISFGKESVHAFIEAEHNAHQLKQALDRLSGGNEGGFVRLMKQSEELQKNGIFSDDAIQQTQAQLANYGLTANQIQKLTPLIADMAARTGKDLGEATDIAIKGINGQTKGLKMLGIDYKDTGDKAKNLAILTEKLTKFQGANADQLQTAEGRMKRWDNAVDDMKETVGNFLVGIGVSYLNYWDALTGKISFAEAQVRNYRMALNEQLSGSVDNIIANLDSSSMTSAKKWFYAQKAASELQNQINQLRIKARSASSSDEMNRISAQIQALHDQQKRLLDYSKTVGKEVKQIIDDGTDEANQLLDLSDRIDDEIQGRYDKQLELQKDALRRRADNQIAYAKITTSDEQQLSDEILRIHTDLIDALAEIDKQKANNDAQRRIVDVRATNATEKQKATLIAAINESLAQQLAAIDGKAANEKTDAAQKEYDDIVTQQQKALDEQENQLKEAQKKQQQLGKERFDETQKLRIAQAKNEKQLQDAELTNAQETHDQKLAQLDAEHEAGLLAEEDYLRKKALLEAEYANVAQQNQQKELDTFLSSLDASLKGVEDGLNKRYQANKNALDREGTMIDQNISMQSERFNQGLDNQLAYEEKRRAENADKMYKLEKQRRKQEQAQQLASLFLDITKDLAKGGDPNAALRAAAQVAIAKGISDAIAGSAYEGTEDTGSGAGMDSKNGMLWMLHPNERVVPKKLNDKLGGMSNEELVNNAIHFEKMKYLYGPQFSGSVPSDLSKKETADQAIYKMLADEVRGVKKAIEQKPEADAYFNTLGELVTMYRKNGNTTQVTHRKPPFTR